MVSLHLWAVMTFAGHMLGAALMVLGALWIARRGDRSRTDRNAVAGAMVLTAAWSVLAAAFGDGAVIGSLAEIARNLAWVFVIYRLFQNDGRHATLRPIRPVALALAFVEALHLGLLVLQLQFPDNAAYQMLVFQLGAMFRLLVAIGALVLLHNLYAGAGQATRRTLIWTASALAGFWAFELNLFTIAYLLGDVPLELAALRGVVTIAMVPVLIVGARRDGANLRLRPSRAVTFQTLSLLGIGAYLLLMVGMAQSFAMLGGGFGRFIQVAFTFAATVLALVWLPSKRLRKWLRVMAVKHLFQHRYDYRAEWLRFTDTIGRPGDELRSLEERSIKAMADLTDSPGGLLFLRGESDAFELAARWRWRSIDVPAQPFSDALIGLIETEGFILDLDDMRAGVDHVGEATLLPDWLRQEPRTWALVPLLHFERLQGLVLLARPEMDRSLDWEDFDLLRVVGRQLASYLAEQSGEQALLEAARFDEFNRRIAFVMHDIKNLASQLTLLAHNAEKHSDNADFRSDMLITLRNSADKLNTLIARLNRYGSAATDQREQVDTGVLLHNVATRFADVHPVNVLAGEGVRILADGDSLEQAMVHLVQNAVDASDPQSPVYLQVQMADGSVRMGIVDSGTGMSPEFVRNGLFKPFVSSKSGGFGIGAFEARELIRVMGGRLDVESREGLGTRFVATFPAENVAEAAEPIPFNYPRAEVA